MTSLLQDCYASDESFFVAQISSSSLNEVLISSRPRTRLGQSYLMVNLVSDKLRHGRILVLRCSYERVT